MVKDFLSGFRHFASKKVNRVLIILVALVTVVACLFYFFFQGVYQNALVEQMLHRQQLAARSGARSVETFIALMGAQVSSYDQNQDLEEFLINLNDFPIGGVILLDKNGILIDNASRDGIKTEPLDLSNRSYFKFLKDDPSVKFVVSEPIMSKVGYSEGKYIISVASAVLKNGKFDGVVASSIILSHLSQDFFDPVKVTKDTVISLIDSHGQVIFSTDEIELEKIMLQIDSVIKDRKEIKLKIDGDEKMLVSVSPVEYKHDKTWALVVSTPVKDAFMFTLPFENYSLAVLVYILTIIIGFGALMVMVVRISKRDGYREGFINGKKSAQRKK